MGRPDYDEATEGQTEEEIEPESIVSEVRWA